MFIFQLIFRYLDEPIADASLKPRWPSPAYKGLIGNILPQFLSFSEFPFSEPLSSPHQPFPSLVETYAYLRSFAETYLKDERIKLNREFLSSNRGKDGRSLTKIGVIMERWYRKFGTPLLWQLVFMITRCGQTLWVLNR